MKMVYGAVLLLFAASVCTADTIVLTDGQVFRGDIISQNEDNVVVRTATGRNETINRKYVDRIVADEDDYPYEDAPPRRHRERLFRADTYDMRDDELILKLGFDFNGTHTTSHSNLFVEGSGNSSLNGSQSVSGGSSFTIEYISYVNQRLGLGGGVTFQSSRRLSGTTADFDFTPVYGVVKLRTNPEGRHRYAYLIGQLGYNFFSGDVEYTGNGGDLGGGLYVGAGGGIALRRLIIELLYTVHHGTAQNQGFTTNTPTGQSAFFQESGDITYSKLGLNFGFSF